MSRLSLRRPCHERGSTATIPKGSLTYLVDTNVLVRLLVPADPLHPQARATVRKLARKGEAMCVAVQNLIELWNVATRPRDRNGLGKSPSAVDQMLAELEPTFPRLAEPARVYDIWRDLVVRFAVSGVQVHDARLVAVMLANDVSNILTFNVQDFQRYGERGIRPLDPRDA